MRGKPYPLPVPTAGIILNAPPHQVPPNALVAGVNTYLDIDGLYKCRSGFQPLAPTGPGSRISGGISYQDPNLTYENVCATLTGWWALIGGVWTNITDLANPQAGGADDPARFIAFAQGGVYYAIGVNNVNAMRRWTSGNANYSTIAAAPIARDVLVLGSRVVAFNTVESGTRFPRRARWSSFEDATTWAALNFNDMLDADDAIVGARNLGQNAAAVYGGNSIWVIQLNPGGDDASAFTTQELFSGYSYSGPIGPSAICIAEGAHYYLGTDGRVYLFNGIQPQPISDPIDPAVIGAINFGAGSRCHAVYLPLKRAILFFWPASETGSDCQNASYFSLARSVWEPLEAFMEGISASWPATTVTGQTWENDPYLWSTSPYTWDDIPNAAALGVVIGTVAGQVHQFFTSFTDNGTAIPYFATSGLFSVDQSKTHLLDRYELYLKPGSISELVQSEVDAYGAPFQPVTPVVSLVSDISLTSWVNQPILPGPDNPSNYEANYFQLTISCPKSAGGFAFAGGNYWIYLDDRSDYGND